MRFVVARKKTKFCFTPAPGIKKTQNMFFLRFHAKNRREGRKKRGGEKLKETMRFTVRVSPCGACGDVSREGEIRQP